MPIPDTDPDAAPHLALGAWDGPLDHLLDCARRHLLDPATLPARDLAEACAARIDAALAAGDAALPRLADWLVMAAWLVALRAGTLWPDPPAAPPPALPGDRSADRMAARRLADWLAARPQLGQAVFARGMPEALAQPAPATDLTALLLACLAVIEAPGRLPPWQPPRPVLWRVPDALAALRGRLPAWPAAGLALAELVPPEARTPLQRRAALASALVAGLELVREGVLVAEQEHPLEDIRLKK